MQRIVMMVVVVILLSACVPVVSISPLPTPTGTTIYSITPPPPAPTQAPQGGTGLVIGQITGKPNAWTGKQIIAYAAPFKSTTAGNGFFILEPSIHPHTTVNASGAFQINDVPADTYVIVIGPAPEDALAIQEAGQTRVVQVIADQTLDLGKIDLR